MAHQRLALAQLLFWLAHEGGHLLLCQLDTVAVTVLGGDHEDRAEVLDAALEGLPEQEWRRSGALLCSSLAGRICTQVPALSKALTHGVSLRR